MLIRWWIIWLKVYLIWVERSKLPASARRKLRILSWHCNDNLIISIGISFKRCIQLIGHLINVLHIKWIFIPNPSLFYILFLRIKIFLDIPDIYDLTNIIFYLRSTLIDFLDVSTNKIIYLNTILQITSDIMFLLINNLLLIFFFWRCWHFLNLFIIDL